MEDDNATMTCTEWKSYIAGLEVLDAEALSPAAKAHLKSCKKCNIRYSALQMLDRANVLHVEARSTLASRVKARIRGESSPMQRKAARHRRIFTFAAAAAILAAVPLTVWWVQSGPASTRHTVIVHFTLQAPAASSVAVVGDWNAWNPSAQLMERHDGTWEITVRLQPDHTYQYQFLVDNSRWIPDPKSKLTIESGFGGLNSVLTT